MSRVWFKIRNPNSPSEFFQTWLGYRKQEINLGQPLLPLFVLSYLQ
jgi:hypothetical protein